jgi:hypothetical protein
MLGQFLEISVSTLDIIESLAFYNTLGFSELECGDVWPHKYAVVSDGHLCMSDHGFDFKTMKIDDDAFNELWFCDRDGNMISMIEARTFSPPDEEVESSICGNWFEFSLPARDAMRAGRFWAPLAPVMLEHREEPTPHLRFDAAGMSVGLSEHRALQKPSPCFVCDDLTSVLAEVERHTLNIDTNPEYESSFLSLEAPEGTQLYLFEADFLAAEEED